MKYFRVHIVLVFVALAVLLGVVSFETRSSRGQSQSPKADSRVKPTVLKTDPRDALAEKASSIFAAAGERNAALQNELVWTFGGKQQRGWYLYDALINQSLNPQNEASSGGFAAAIADRSLNLAHTPEGGLAPTEKYFKIVSAFRSREYQDQLRRQSPNAGSAGLAVNSPHFTGRALDFYVGGDPVDTKDSNRAIQVKTPVYQWLVRNAERFGFRPYFYEPWHWEYVGVR